MKSQSVLQAFCDTLDECGLVRVPLVEQERMGESVEERLDRFCANLDWSMLFPSTEVRHLDEKYQIISPSRRCYMPFVWSNRVVGGITSSKTCGKLRTDDGKWWNVPGIEKWVVEAGRFVWLSLKLALCLCHAKTFGDIKTKIHQLSARLEGVRDMTERNNILSEIGNLRCKEEVFWAQRAKADFLKYGDANTRWFYARANTRMSTNAICQIEREDESVATEEGEVQQVIVDYVANLCATSRPLHPKAIVASLGARVTDDMNNALCAPYSHVVAWPSSFQPVLLGNSTETDLLFFKSHYVHHGPPIDSFDTIQLIAEAFPSVLECMWQAKEVLDGDELGEFVAVLWECWNSRDQFLFGNRHPDLTHAGERTRAFVRGYREVRLGLAVMREEVAGGGWRPPEFGVLKLNVDASDLGEGRYGWGFMLRYHMGDIVLVGCAQGKSFVQAELEEARACLFAMHQARIHGHDRFNSSLLPMLKGEVI
ncbi:LOW QUALITY PROTEIN: hypothetical protein Cgig2_006910 [Carnegiea gigantea]|uniref:RNase H type-1 domain-containing protein n=1 Tax=Carnegiea gigantea TaxID=171969 RepID=A0A9Q1K3R9_9CARY|nr:LOW QUALITY PROTEIN: hypothetical protein Cgig2_006910 [Carnegiea gigantea]